MPKFPRHQKIGLLLYSMAYILVEWQWPTVSISSGEWENYAVMLSLISAGMACMSVVDIALFHALSETPIVKFLYKKGALKGLLFNLTTCAILCSIALGLSFIGSLPSHSQTQVTLQITILYIATISAVTGFLYFLYFGPIGYAFWLLLGHIGHKPSPAVVHDFDKPTDLR